MRLFAQPKERKPDPLPKPDAPIVQGQPGEGAIKKKLVKAGRGGTILTGQLIPRNIGKNRLLG